VPCNAVQRIVQRMVVTINAVGTWKPAVTLGVLSTELQGTEGFAWLVSTRSVVAKMARGVGRFGPRHPIATP
jgi:hypothetical protein